MIHINSQPTTRYAAPTHSTGRAWTGVLASSSNKQSLMALLVGLLLTGCAAESENGSRDTTANRTAPSRADSIITAAISYQGGELLENVDLAFRFRHYDYRVRRNNGMFEYERQFTDSLARSGM